MNGREALFERIKAIADALGANDDLESEDSADLETERADRIKAIRAAIEIERDLLLERDLDSQNRRLKPDHVDSHVARTAFGNQIAYVHNGYNFESTRTLRSAALVTRISFIPIFLPIPDQPIRSFHQTPHNPVFDEITNNVKQRLEEIRARAIHSGDSFSGGKDSIIKRTDKFLDFNEPIITTLRSMDRCSKYIIAALEAESLPEVRSVFAEAKSQNDRMITALQSAGASSRLSMARDYTLRLGPSSSTTLSWVRHHSHYQTITVKEEMDLGIAHTGIAEPLKLGSAIAAPTLSDIIDNIPEHYVPNLHRTLEAPLQRTAIDQLPHKWADHVYGRYLQGANFLVLPALAFFSETHISRCSQCPPFDHQATRTLQADWTAALMAAGLGLEASAEQPSLEPFVEIWRKGESQPSVARAAGRFLLRLVGPFVEEPSPAWQRREFAMFSAADGMAGVFSRLQNVATVVDDHSEFRMSETIVIDFGMSPAERGRLLDQLAEFGTQRVLAISALGTFRFLHDALDQVQRSLSKAVEEWLDARPFEQTRDMTRTRGYLAEHEEEAVLLSNGHFVKTLEEITTDLTLLDDLVDGGISQRARSAGGASETLHDRFAQMRARRIPGFMSLQDFIDDRFSRDSRSMAAAGRRYDELRRRVGELSALVSANIQIGQNREQERLLDKIDRLTLFGITYYAGSITAYVAGPLVLLFVFRKHTAWRGDFAGVPSAIYHWLADPPTELEATDDIMKVAVFILFLLLAVFIGLDVFIVLAREIKDAPREWRKWLKKLMSRDNE